MIKGVIFDLDGVLVYTDEMHYLAWKRLADELGIHGFTRKDNERQRGVSRMASLEIVLEKSDTVYTEEEKVKLAEKKNDYYKELLQQLDDGAVLKGAKEALIKLREMGILIGVGSVSKNTPVILEKTGLLPLIDKVSCGLDITKSKPDPEVFLVAAKKLALPVEECLVVEDAAAGIQAAKAAGMRSLAVGPYYEKLGAAYQTPGLYAVDHWEEMLK